MIGRNFIVNRKKILITLQKISSKNSLPFPRNCQKAEIILLMPRLHMQVWQPGTERKLV